ncbi:rhamnogalacturonan acetylesterase [Nocardiopsis sp. TSRI0078]|uniref:rhamnogalacturonan acetylesterase n=1 Tax=unclassified Nocardiopsis TaxID=2649073 RepID=UPI00093F3D4B|nr:rhamnogalacturonan acetylesterase [Nocardiopsis sp. TSRI0078]OKI13006.1 rhamnogalacturonan acetylesterase [Nocardiopsis sp. TSRI0078]
MIRRSFLTASAVALGLPLAAAPSWAHSSHRSPRVFVAGDSTASTYAAREAPRAGWGQALGLFLGRGASVDNRALSGASSKSFADLGLLDGVLDDIRPGDHLLVSFGHNDAKDEDPERYTEPWSTYQRQLGAYIDGARERGAHPTLVTSVERRRFTAEGAPRESHGDYPAAMRELGARENVPVVDLTALSLGLWGELGPEGTKSHFLWLEPGEHPNHPDGVEDNTHFRAHGAVEVARLVARELKRLRVLPPRLVRRLGDSFPDPEGALAWPRERPV